MATSLAMTKAVRGEDNIYFETESKEASAYTGVYEDVIPASESTAAARQRTVDKQAANRAKGKNRQTTAKPPHSSSEMDTEMILQRMLYMMAALIVVSFLIAAATLILGLTIMLNKNSTAPTDFAGSRGLRRKCAVQSPDKERIVRRLAENLTATEKRLEKIVHDLTERLVTTKRELKLLKSKLYGEVNEISNLWMAINSTAETTTNLTSKLRNICNCQGPTGPAGQNRSIGPPGPKGSGNFSACQYKLVTERQTPGAQTTTAGLAEPNGKRLLGVSCSTNYAAEYNLLSSVHNNVRRYTCICKGTSSWFKPSGDPSNCYIHYWECPFTT